MHVFVAEDNPVNQVLAVKLLQKLGHTAVTASSGLEVLRVLETTTPDVILMDVQMPEMDGFEATAAIRPQEAGGPRIPIVALTAHAAARLPRAVPPGGDGRLPGQADQD